MKNYLLLLLMVVCVACNQQIENEEEQPSENTVAKSVVNEERDLSKQFKDYWYDGTAEITSYDLSQSRYGELRQGTAVMIFVTEPFDPEEQVKADQNLETNRPVLKLNATRNFLTGIYPYSIMSSTFLPLDREDNAIKVAGSIQEWCGQTYMQFNQRADSYEVTLHSYFQSEGNKVFEIDNAIIENQIPAQLRLGPEKMPVGDIKIIPSAEFLRLKHIETQPVEATAKLSMLDDGYLYSVKFTEIGRTIAFKTEKTFPYKILSWMDRYKDGATPMVSTGNLKKTIKSAYWNKNANRDLVLRDSLGL